jgi:hypothetical protein
MCDCYEIKCESCGANIAIHIANFSAGRNQTKGWCHKCHDALWEYLEKTAGRIGPYLLFSDRITMPEQVGNATRADVSKTIFFLVQQPSGIHLN